MSRTYKLLSGNRGFVQAMLDQPPAGTGWRTTADIDDQVGTTMTWIYTPCGELLHELGLNPQTRSEITRLIQAEEEKRRTRYTATTGSLRAWTRHRSLEGDGWRLEVSHLRGFMSEHVQLLDTDGRTILANVLCEPYETLGERLTATMDAHHRQLASDRTTPRTPLICVRSVPTGSILVTLWISGVEFETLAPNWGADAQASIQPGPDAMAQLRALLADWQQQRPNARIDSEIPLEESAPVDAEVAAASDHQPLITVQLQPNQSVKASLLLSGREGGDAKGRPAESFSVNKGPDRQPLLHGTLRPWIQRYPEARIEADVEIVPAWIEEQRDIGRRQLTQATPAKAALPAARELGQASKHPPLVIVEKHPAGGAEIRLWLSGTETPGGKPDRVRTVSAKDLGGAIGMLQHEYMDAEIRYVDPPVAPPPRVTTDDQAPERIREIRIEAISHFPGGNVREQFDDLADLAESIRQHGVLEPLLVNEREGRYVLIAGERRLRAAGKAGLTTVPCRVLNTSDQEALELMVIENIQRQDLNPLEEARAYQRLLALPGATQVSVAERLGKHRVYVVEMLQLLDLPPKLATMVANSNIAKRVGLEFLWRTREASATVRDRVAEAIAQEKPTAREVRSLIERILTEHSVARATPPARSPEPAATSHKTPDPSPPATESIQQGAQPVTAGPAPQASPPASGVPAPPPAVQPEPPSRPQLSETPRVGPQVERARQLAEIGRRFWEKKAGDPWDDVGADRYQTCLFARECYLPLDRVFRHWNLRRDLGATSIPGGMGQFCRINIPEQLVWIKGYDQFATTTEMKLNGGRLLVKLTTGGVEAAYNGEMVYFRIELRQQDQGGHKSLEQQMVLQDGDRHIVVTGSGSAMIRKGLVPLLADLVNDLPGLPDSDGQ